MKEENYKTENWKLIDRRVETIINAGNAVREKSRNY